MTTEIKTPNAFVGTAAGSYPTGKRFAHRAERRQKAKINLKRTKKYNYFLIPVVKDDKKSIIRS